MPSFAPALAANPTLPVPDPSANSLSPSTLRCALPQHDRRVRRGHHRVDLEQRRQHRVGLDIEREVRSAGEDAPIEAELETTPRARSTCCSSAGRAHHDARSPKSGDAAAPETRGVAHELSECWECRRTAQRFPARSEIRWRDSSGASSRRHILGIESAPASRQAGRPHSIPPASSCALLPTFHVRRRRAAPGTRRSERRLIVPTETNRVLVKMRPSTALGAAPGANLRPLYSGPSPASSLGVMGDSTPQWFIADLPDGAATPWDLAHARVADQLGVAESDVIFAEPDIVHDVYRRRERRDGGRRASVRRPSNACRTRRTTRAARRSGRIASGTSATTSRSSAARARRHLHRAAHAHRAPRHRLLPDRTSPCRAHLLTDLRTQLRRGRRQSEQRRRPEQRAAAARQLRPRHRHARASSPARRSRAVQRRARRRARRRRRAAAHRRSVSSCSAPARSRGRSTTPSSSAATWSRMSMGGLPSQAWARGRRPASTRPASCICAAAGNHVGALPPRTLVYPARYRA